MASQAPAADRYIVGLNPRAAADLPVIARGLANPPAHTYDVALTGFAGVLTPAERSRLARDPRVLYIEPDLPVELHKGKPPGVGGGKDKTPPPQELPWGVDRIDAELNGQNGNGVDGEDGPGGNGGSGVAVAVIDTGIDLKHPDLEGNVIDGYNAIRPGRSAKDDNGHGTHVAGIIAAVDNSIGYVGVAPSAKVVAVKVLDRRGSGWISDIIAGINWVAANHGAYNIKVANMSLGARGTSSALATAITNATAEGITFVVSAGNSYADAAYYVPASYGNVICVSALDPDDTFASYSNWGGVVDMIAPGTDVPSLWKGGEYETKSGTSMAAPHVAGAAALWLDNNSGGFTEVLGALTDAVGEDGWGPWPGDPDDDDEPLVDAETL